MYLWFKFCLIIIISIAAFLAAFFSAPTIVTKRWALGMFLAGLLIIAICTEMELASSWMTLPTEAFLIGTLTRMPLMLISGMIRIFKNRKKDIHL